MSSISFEVVEKTPVRSRRGSVLEWLLEVCEVAKSHEGNTLRIDLSQEVNKFVGLTVKDLQMRVNQYKNPYGNRSKPFVLSTSGYEVTFRGVSAKAQLKATPYLYITYTKPVTESEG